jgi:VanZ family protein
MAKPKIFSFTPAVLWLIITFILLTLPGSDIPKSDFFDLVYFDKWVHTGMFGLLMILWSYPFIKTENATQKKMLLISVLIIIYGILMEFVQKYFAVERDFDVFDMIADSIGVLVAWLWLSKRFHSKINKPL